VQDLAGGLARPLLSRLMARRTVGPEHPFADPPDEGIAERATKAKDKPMAGCRAGARPLCRPALPLPYQQRGARCSDSGCGHRTKRSEIHGFSCGCAKSHRRSSSRQHLALVQPLQCCARGDVKPVQKQVLMDCEVLQGRGALDPVSHVLAAKACRLPPHHCRPQSSRREAVIGASFIDQPYSPL
jgi:hypothetical protein